MQFTNQTIVMLSLLKIKNIALVENLSMEFGEGLNLLTGETGSGKSIIVDSLGALTGARVSADLIKEGEEKAEIEGLFLLKPDSEVCEFFEESGFELGDSDEVELIIRRELSLAGRNRIFVNNQLVTQSFLKKVGIYIADIHGQGEQATLFKPANHLEILDKYAQVDSERDAVQGKFAEISKVRAKLRNLKEDESQKLQLMDILRFQVEEIEKGNLEAGEDETLEEEKKRLNNSEKLSQLSGDSYGLLYENESSVIANLEKVARITEELNEYDSDFGEYKEGLDSAKAVLEDLAYTLRDFKGTIQFSPERLGEIENRLAEITRLKRKYGGSLETVLAHFEDAKERLENIETSELKEQNLKASLEKLESEYLKIAGSLSKKRKKAAREFEKRVEENLAAVALEKAKFVVNFKDRESVNSENFTAKGIDEIEFYFSANPGEPPKPLVKVASGGEASRVMLILKTTAKVDVDGKAAVFDEVDAGIGGRVAEAVGLKLKELAGSQQVLCVTHQPQVAAMANQHFVVEKETKADRTKVGVRLLKKDEQVEEIARMLAGESVTDSARKHARELIGGTKKKGKGI